MYENGDGIEQSYIQSKKFYEQACNVNHMFSFNYLGLMYEKGSCF